MTTLKASAAASQALYRKQIDERARIVRGRVEAMPGAGLQAKMDSVDNRIRLLHLAQASELMDQIDDALERHRQALVDADMAAAGQAQDQLLAERGVETVSVGVVRTRDGWIWLKNKNRVSSERAAIGDRYLAIYRGAQRDMLAASGANDNGGGGGHEALIHHLSVAVKDLRHIQNHISGATGSGRLVALLDAVVGRGETVRDRAGGDKELTAILTDQLCLALDMAGVAMRTLPSTLAREAENGPRERGGPSPKPVTWFRGAEFG